MGDIFDTLGTPVPGGGRIVDLDKLPFDGVSPAKSAIQKTSSAPEYSPPFTQQETEPQGQLFDLDKISFDQQQESPSVGEHIKSDANAMARGALKLPGETLKAVGVLGTGAINLLTGDDSEASDDLLYRAGDYLNKKIDQSFLSDTRMQGGIEDQISEGLGQFGGQMFLAGASGGASALAPATSAIPTGAKIASREALQQTATSMGVGVGMSTADAYEDAIRNGADELTAQKVGAWGAIIGTSEAIPISNMFKIVGKYAPKAAERLLDIGIEALEEGGQEAFQQIAGNYVAQLNYDEQRKLMDGVAAASGVGGSVGAIAATMAQLLVGKHGHIRINNENRDLLKEQTGRDGRTSAERGEEAEALRQARALADRGTDTETIQPEVINQGNQQVSALGLPAPQGAQLALPAPNQINMPGAFPMPSPSAYDPRGSMDERQAGQEPVSALGINQQPVIPVESQPLTTNPVVDQNQENVSDNINDVPALPQDGGIGLAATGRAQPVASEVPPVKMAGGTANEQQVSELDSAANEAATSPKNNLPEPTQGQIEAGNYKKGHVSIHGLNIAIENPAGSTRKGTDEDGKAWETKLNSHYGYIKRTEGADGDHVDVFLTNNAESAKSAFVVDQIDPKTGKFDEVKIVIGPTTVEEAKTEYLSNYDETGTSRIGAISEVPMPALNAWLSSTKKTKKPLAYEEQTAALQSEDDGDFVDPVVSPQAATGAVGLNSKGYAVFEDENGNRFYYDGLRKVVPPSTLSPDFTRLDARTLFKGGHSDFLTAEELQAFQRGIEPTVKTESGALPSTLNSGIPVDAIVKELGKFAGNVQEAMPHLVDLGTRAIQEGHTTLQAFSKKMQEWLGGLYNGFRSSMVKVWTIAKQKAKEERGSLPLRPGPASKQDQDQEQAELTTSQSHKVIDRLRNVFDNPGGLSGLPDWKEYLAKRYRVLGSLSSIKDATRKLYDTFKVATPEDAKAIYDYLTSQDADTSAIKNPLLRVQAERAKNMIVAIGENLVAYGMLDEDTFEANKGAYLPRVYLKHLLGDELFQALGGGGKKMNLEYLKRRKDISEEVRTFVLGEIKDAAYLVSRSFAIPTRDMALYDWLTQIASNGNWVMPKMIVNWSVEKDPMKHVGKKVRYKKNRNGTFDLEINRVRTVETSHKGIRRADLENFLGGAKLAEFVAAGKGKPELRKAGEVYRATPWKKLGPVKYRQNADGTFNFKIKEKVRSVDSHEGVQEAELGKYLSESKTDAVANDTGRIVGGKMVTPFWLLSEASRLRNQVPHMPEEHRSRAREIADRMTTTANRAKENAGWVGEAPDGFAQIPDTPRYGPLRGMVVRKEIHNDLVGSVKISMSEPSMAEKILGERSVLAKVNGLWKWSKVAANVAGQVRNFVSNMILLNISGVNNPMVVVDAIREIRTNGKHWQIAKRYGVKEATFSNTEISRIETEMLDAIMKNQGGWVGAMNGLMKALTDGDLSAAKESGKGIAVGAKSIAGKGINLAGDIYQAMEAIGKTAKIIDSMKKGASAEQAALEAHKWLFDYSLVGKSVKYLRNIPFGMPFITFSVKILPRLVEVSVRKPWRMAPYVALSFMLQSIIAAMVDMDDDDLKKIKESLPQWINEKQHVYVLPMKDKDGTWQAVDVGYFFPWTQWTEFGESILAGDMKGTMKNFPFSFGGPLPDLVVAAKTNTDAFTGREIVDPLGTPAEQASQVFGYLYQVAAPLFLTNQGWAGKLHQTMNEGGMMDTYGNVKPDQTQAWLRLVGVNVYGYDPVRTRARNIQHMKNEIAELRRRRTRELRNSPFISESERHAIVEKYNSRIKERVSGIREYAARTKR